MIFRRQYADPVGDEELALQVGLSCDPDEDRTEQHHAEETDINVMLGRMGASPERGLPVVTVSKLIRDVTLLPETLQEAFDIVARGREAFEQLPAGVKAYFSNDPRRFVMASEDELIAAGIPAAEPPPEASSEAPSADPGTGAT